MELPRGITRHEYRRTRGLLVRGVRRQASVTERVRRLFSFSVYGGEAEALRAAVDWQRQEGLDRPVVRPCKRRGYGYVTPGERTYKTRSGERRTTAVIQAWYWDDEGTPSSTSYSIAVHGHEQAEALANDWLARQSAEAPSDAEAAA